jgi:hypothetical protein
MICPYDTPASVAYMGGVSTATAFPSIARYFSWPSPIGSCLSKQCKNHQHTAHNAEILAQVSQTGLVDQDKYC